MHHFHGITSHINMEVLASIQEEPFEVQQWVDKIFQTNHLIPGYEFNETHKTAGRAKGSDKFMYTCRQKRFLHGTSVKKNCEDRSKLVCVQECKSKDESHLKVENFQKTPTNSSNTKSFCFK